jgi:hypothetical protein
MLASMPSIVRVPSTVKVGQSPAGVASVTITNNSARCHLPTIRVCFLDESVAKKIPHRLFYTRKIARIIQT